MTDVKVFLIPGDLYHHVGSQDSGHETIRLKVEDKKMFALENGEAPRVSYQVTPEDASFFNNPDQRVRAFTAGRDMTYMAKFNKDDDPTHTLEEVRISRLLRDLLNDLTGEGRVVSSPIHLGVGYKGTDPTLRVQAVVAELFENFTSFKEFNLIDIIAQIELGEFGAFDDLGLDEKYRSVVEALIADKGQRQRLFKQYMTDLYVRRLTHEDDFHGDNVGTNFQPGIALEDLNILQIDFDMAVQPLRAAKGSDNTRSSQAQMGTNKLEYTDESIAHFYKHSRSGFWMSTGNILQTPHFALTKTFAFTNNKGRYSNVEARRFKELCKRSDYQSITRQVIATISEQFLNYNPEDLYLEIGPLQPSILENEYGVVLSADERRRTDLALCQFVADQQAALARILADEDSETAKIVTELGHDGSASTLVEKYKGNLSRYQTSALDGAAFKPAEEKLGSVLVNLKDDPIRRRLQVFTSVFSETFAFGDLARKKAAYLKYFKHEFVQKNTNTLEDFEALVNYWKTDARHQDSVITQVRKVSVIGRAIKQKKVFNKFSSTYVSMRDLLVKQIVEKQRQLDDQPVKTQDDITEIEGYSALLKKLKNFQSLRVSASYNPVKYSVRFRLGLRYAVWGNYNPISVGSYWASRKQKHGAVLAATRIAIRGFPKLLEIMFLVLEESVRSIRRRVFKNDGELFELENTGALIFFNMMDELLALIDEVVGVIYKFVFNFNYTKDLGITNAYGNFLFKFFQSLLILPLLNALLTKGMDSNYKAVEVISTGFYYLVMALPMMLRAGVATALHGVVPLLTQAVPALIKAVVFSALSLTFYTFKVLRHVMRRIASPFQSFQDYQRWIDRKYESGTSMYYLAHMANGAFSAVIIVGFTVGAVFAAPVIAAAAGATAGTVAAIAVPSLLILKLLAVTGLAQALGVAGAVVTATAVLSTALAAIGSTVHQCIRPSKSLSVFEEPEAGDMVVRLLRDRQDEREDQLGAATP